MKSKIILASVSLAGIMLLSGCWWNKQAAVDPSVNKNSTKSAATAEEKASNVLPSGVATSPGVNVDEEVKNITEDLKATDSKDFDSDGLTNTDLNL